MPNQIPNQPYTLYMSNFVNKITKFAETISREAILSPPPDSRAIRCKSVTCESATGLRKLVGRLSLTKISLHHYMKPRFLAAALLGVICCVHTSASDLAVKTNLLYDATLTANLGVEMQVASKWSIDLSGNYNPWTLSGGKKWKHWMIQPEARYWFCQPLGGHFVGFHLLGGEYNMGHWGHEGNKILNNDTRPLKDHRYQGWYAGAGIAYGYSWLLGRHWNLEAEIGFGWAYTRYDTFECVGCGRKIDSNKVHNYVGPTKVALNLVYVF